MLSLLTRSFNWTVNITFVRSLTRRMTSQSHDVHCTGLYAISYAQTWYSSTLPELCSLKHQQGWKEFSECKYLQIVFFQKQP